MMYVVALLLLGVDFPVCAYSGSQYAPSVIYANDQYYVFWRDNRWLYEDSTRAVFGARVATDGTILDPDGNLLYRNQTQSRVDIAYDGTNFLGAFRNS